MNKRKDKEVAKIIKAFSVLANSPVESLCSEVGVTTQDFIDYVSIVLRDEFNADIISSGSEITVIFKNGQKFYLTVTC